jgi:chemotaxis protein CheC
MAQPVTSLSIIQAAFTAATHSASSSVSRWTSGVVTLTLHEVRELPLEDVLAELQLADEPQVSIVLTIDGECGGAMVLMFDRSAARQLASCIIGQTLEAAETWDELSRSALEETGNILTCAYLTTLSELLDESLEPSPPYFIEDFGASVLEQALVGQADCDAALVCCTAFRAAGGTLAGNVFFFPNPELRYRLEESFRRYHLASR